MNGLANAVFAAIAKAEQRKERHRVWMRARRAKARAEGKCIICRKLDAKPKCSCCPDCIGKGVEFKAQRRAGAR
jgi:hypothetical protein